MCCCWFYDVTSVFLRFKINALKSKTPWFSNLKDEFCNRIRQRERPHYFCFIIQRPIDQKGNDFQLRKNNILNNNLQDIQDSLYSQHISVTIFI